MARPYFLDYMKRIESDRQGLVDVNKTFFRPDGELDIEIDCDTYEELYHKTLIDEKAKRVDDEYGDH